MPLSRSEISNLVAALLAVNFYSVERACALMPRFEALGLLDPTTYVTLDQGQVMSRMIEAGYARGGFVPILSFRLYPLMEAISAGGLDVLRELVAADDRAAFTARLSSIHGFGPRTVENAWQLWRSLGQSA